MLAENNSTPDDEESKREVCRSQAKNMAFAIAVLGRGHASLRLEGGRRG